MHKERWSPYLTDSESRKKRRDPGHNEVYELTKERKNAAEQLQIMRVRIKQLELEEKKAMAKVSHAIALTDTILERRVEKKHREEFKDKIKKLRLQEIAELKERNREFKEDLKTSISVKKEAILENKKSAAKEVKELRARSKLEMSKRISNKSSSASPKPPHLSRFSNNEKLKEIRVEEEKSRMTEAVKEIRQLEDLEKVLIENLRIAYEKQKAEETKVAVLISNPVIISKHELNQISSQNLSVISSL